MNPIWTATLAPLGPFSPLTLHLSAQNECAARIAIARLYPNRDVLSVKRYEAVRESEKPGVNPNENCLQGFECPECGSYGPFRIGATVSGETLVMDDGTEGVEGDVEWSDDSTCRCTDCGHSSTVRNFRGNPEPAFGTFQSIAASAYDEGDHLCRTPDDISKCGDSLLAFIMKELAESEDCDSAEEAVSRMDTAIRQLERVRDALETTLPSAERAILRMQDAQAAH